eukprot:TRINITY_DN14818_c0_g1_i1.p1 TRINITY_DN14818_c0_g1~~TRINITY_DN14818_c0_g1_i1.p1  ORF type:complete len:279 (+),score=22.68 TRINITY_DN14818_c0_g1_i1:635-1471(+)
MDYSRGIRTRRGESPLRHVSRSPSPAEGSRSWSPRRASYYTKHPVCRSPSRDSSRGSPHRRPPSPSPRASLPSPMASKDALASSRASSPRTSHLSPRSLDSTKQVIDSAVSQGRKDLVFELADFVEEMNFKLQAVIAKMPLEGYPNEMRTHVIPKPQTRRGSKTDVGPGHPLYPGRKPAKAGAYKPKPVVTKEMIERKRWNEVKSNVTRERRERESLRRSSGLTANKTPASTQAQAHTAHRSLSPAIVHPKPLSPKPSDTVYDTQVKSPTSWFKSSRK